MGKYLTSSVVTKFKIISGWYNDFNLEKEIDSILKDISNIIDSSMYNLTEKKENSYEFSLKPELFNKNIHELIKEIYPLTSLSHDWFKDIQAELEKENKTIYDKEFIEKHPLEINIDEYGKYYIEINEDEMLEEEYLYGPLYWLITDKRLYKNVDIYAKGIILWNDWNKYSGEDETPMLCIINNMKAKYYSSPLSKTLIYTVFG